MLYVFIVSSGSILKFDMNLAVKKVSELKAEIERTFQLSIEDQVLLCSGGEELQDENIVGNYYGAGTDTNPIFLFRKYINECDYSYNIPLHTSIDLSIEDDVYGCANMSPSSSTATVRAALAQRFAEAAVKGRRECDELVHAQHLQQQGWAAVIANLEDGKDILLKRKLHCEELFLKYLEKRSHFQEVIKTFPDDIELLAKIPLSPKLLLGSEYVNEGSESERTLLSWICTQPRTFFDSLIEKCQRSLEELNEQCLSALNEDVAAVLRNADNPDIKEVKGIEERLSLLNKQIEEAKKLEKDQRDLASWFSHTQGRINRDPMVLPDLCGTFQKQLLLMLENHKCLRGILERCTKAKLELSESINYRVKYISHVESEMYGLQLRIKFLEKYVQSVTMQIESFEQAHLAPKRYIQLLAEAFRRRLFSTNYMKWASEVSALTSKLYLKEISIRKSFDNEDSKNIVDNLFPGMEDVPPPFAIECPKPFDQHVPPIVMEDLEMLKTRFPELAHFCEVPPPDPMPYVLHPETDSAFSSNVPSSKIVEDSADSGVRNQLEKEQASPQKNATPSGDYSSLPSEYASMPNEVFSLTSSPFEDPLLPTSQLDSASKRTKQQIFETVAEKVSSPIREVESDGEEFETVDRCGPSIEIRTHSSGRKRSASAPRPNSTSEVININKIASDKCPKLSKARSDGDAISPIQERLKSSDSLLASTDFQSTEYYIDDSMPSSYTESNATSPLLQSSRMVKSHHVVVAELQKQVDEKNGALVGAMSSLKNSRSNILKLHAKISALQKFIHEMQSSLQSDLSNLKTYVKEEFWEKMSEVSEIIEKINLAMAELEKQTSAEKEEAVNKAQSDAKNMEMEYLKRLEVECQKLSDAENQIHNYEHHLLQVLQNLEEMKLENQMLEKELNLKKEVIQSMMLEHELELDSLRNQMRQEIQGKEDEIFKLTQNNSENESTVQDLQKQKQCLAEDLMKQNEEKVNLSSLLAKKETELSDKLKELQQLREEIKCLQDEKESNKSNAIYEEKIQSLQHELEETKQNFSERLQEMENAKEQALNELKEKLSAKHRSEMESLRSRYKLAVSTTAMEKSVVGITENLESETAFSPEDLKKIITESREKWEAEKNDHIKALIEEHEKKLQEAVNKAVTKENVKCYAEKIRTIVNMRKECDESIEKSKSRLVAELQVSFNEAINSVTKEKDVIIEELNSKVSELEAKLCSIGSQVEKYSHHSNESMLSQSDSGASSSYKVLPRDEERLIENLKTELQSYLNISDQRGISGPSQDDQSRSDLLKGRRLSQNKLGLCIDCTFKISILTCDAGDLILLCYENKYENFVAFHIGQFLHMLHTDCLQPLGLKTPAGPTEGWALGVVTNKEFCVAKKACNRYKMKVGSKFYRIKVKPWDREKAVEDFLIHRNSQSTVSTPSTVTPGTLTPGILTPRTLTPGALPAQSSASEDSERAKAMSSSSI